MYKMVKIDKRALRVILNALNEKTGDYTDVNEFEFISVLNTMFGYAVIFRSYQHTADILISVFTDNDDELQYIVADLLYIDHVESIKMTHTKLCSLMEEQI